MFVFSDSAGRKIRKLRGDLPARPQTTTTQLELNSVADVGNPVRNPPVRSTISIRKDV